MPQNIYSGWSMLIGKTIKWTNRKGMKMKKYRLLKDYQMIDGIKIIVLPKGSEVVNNDGVMPTDGYMGGFSLKPIPKLIVENNPEWFEEVKDSELFLTRIGTAPDGDIYTDEGWGKTYLVKLLQKDFKENEPWQFRLGIKTDSTLFNADYKVDPHYTNDASKINRIIMVREVKEGGLPTNNFYLSNNEKEIIEAIRKAIIAGARKIDKILIGPLGIVVIDRNYEYGYF